MSGCPSRRRDRHALIGEGRDQRQRDLGPGRRRLHDDRDRPHAGDGHLEPFPIHRSPWCIRSSVLAPTPAIPTGSNRSETSVASRGAPESKSATSTSNAFGPAVPGVMTSVTFMVVAKSLPVSVTRAGGRRRRVHGRAWRQPGQHAGQREDADGADQLDRHDPAEESGPRLHPRDRTVPVERAQPDQDQDEAHLDVERRPVRAAEQIEQLR